VSFTDLPLGSGVSLKPEYFGDVATITATNMWFEVHPENYMVEGGPRLHGLQDTADRFPVSFHGVGASLGGPVRPHADHIRSLSRLIKRINPAAVSEHAAWSGIPGHYFAELLPLPRTSEALSRLVDGIDCLQEGIGRAILLENPSNYLAVRSDRDEADFLTEVAQRAGCGLLLDVNNLHVSANNCGLDPNRYIRSLPPHLVGEIHIAGFTADEILGDKLLIDSHAAPVAEVVWQLLRVALAHLGPVPVLVERDANLPPFADLMRERTLAEHTIHQSLSHERTDGS
jgi:uncharacterized protein